MEELFSSFLSSGYFISWLGPCGVSDWTERILWVFWRGLSFYRECQETVHQMLPVARTALNNMWEKITLCYCCRVCRKTKNEKLTIFIFYLLLRSESIWFLFLFTIIIIFSIYILDFGVNIFIFMLWSNAAQSLGYLNSHIWVTTPWSTKDTDRYSYGLVPAWPLGVRCKDLTFQQHLLKSVRRIHFVSTRSERTTVSLCERR